MFSNLNVQLLGVASDYIIDSGGLISSMKDSANNSPYFLINANRVIAGKFKISSEVALQIAPVMGIK